jgi:AcrR family transcriptional regulator
MAAIGNRHPADGPLAGLAAAASPPAGAAHRERLVLGMVAAVAERGYAATTITDVVRHARVSRRTFYEHFADKEACYLALYEDTGDELLELIAGTAVDAPWEERLESAARAYFGRVAQEPALMRAALVEIHTTGPAGRRLRRDVRQRYADLLRALSADAAAGDAGLRPLSPALATAVVGGINELMLEAVEAGEEERLGELAGAATELLRAVLRA